MGLETITNAKEISNGFDDIVWGTKWLVVGKVKKWTTDRDISKEYKTTVF